MFVISHNRPKCKTAKYLSEHSKLSWYIIIDDTDKYTDDYIKLWGIERIKVFNKNDIILNTDTFTHDKLPTSAVYARNFVESIATSKYFVVLDDDISDFRFRYFTDKMCSKRLEFFEFDTIIELYTKFMESSEHMNWICMSTNSVYVGGSNVFTDEFITNQRLGYNIFIRKNTNKISWKSFIYEDLITSIYQAIDGKLNLTLPFVTFTADEMGKSSDTSGNSYYTSTSSLYRSMFCVVANPSCTKLLYKKGKFIPCTIKDKAFPKIISGGYKNEITT